jgi:hypothetical protein
MNNHLHLMVKSIWEKNKTKKIKFKQKRMQISLKMI